jgi:hypothetical protein
MSVEKAGPIGYEYQYLVSVYVALKYFEKENIQIFIEKENGEDLQLQFNEGDKSFIIDVQVKKREKQIDLQEFAEWISHFDKKKSDQNLFTKLLSEKNRFVLYVTNSRCMDEVSLFIANNHSITDSLDVGINDTLLKKLKESSIESFKDEKRLSKERKEFLENFFETVNKSQFRSILKKYKIWEMLNKEKILQEITQILNKEFYVPQSKIEILLLELLEIIRNGRDNSESIIPSMRKKLIKYRGNRVFFYDEDKHVIRKEKITCNEILELKNVLLLTGVSFCGKTYLAREVAQEYQDKGYTVNITNELYGENGGLSFLRNVSQEDRLLILEDPFGHHVRKENVRDILSQIKTIVDSCDIHRKLIITTRRDVLLGIMNKNSIEDCRISQHEWVDLTVSDIEFGRKMWESYYGDSNDSLETFTRVNEWLVKQEKEEFLQPGQIFTLYNTLNEVKDLKNMDTYLIINTARVDSEDLANAIEDRGYICKKIFIALGLSCNTFKQVSLEDLSFILSDLDETPSIEYEPDKIFAIEYTLSEVNEFKYPSYSRELDLSDEYKNELRYLLNQGYIKLDQLTKMIIFTHPIYHFASQILLKKCLDDIFDSDEVLKLANKSLSALSKNTNICALASLESYYLESKDQKIKEMILKSLYSIYPSVRERVVMFFDSRINELNEEEYDQLINMMKFLREINDEILSWQDGEPYFSKLYKRSLFGGLLEELNQKEFSIDINEKLSRKENVSSEEMWLILNSERINDNNPNNLKILKHALTFDEVFIREKAIFHIFEKYAHEFNEIEIDKYLDSHEHPNVIYKIFRGSLNNWFRYKPEIKRKILNYFKDSLGIVSVVIRSLHFLENFDNEYRTEGIDWSQLNDEEKRELWSVWHEIFIELLNKFPSKYIRMNEAHMVKVVGASLEYVSDKTKIVNLGIAWINWLEKYSEHHLAEDYGMSVAEYLIKGTEYDSNCREEVFKKLISTTKTSFITANIKVIIDYWEYLSDHEKQQVIELVISDREDISWIHAVILNRKNVPEELQHLLFGELALEDSIKHIVKQLIDKNLLEQCINVHCGFPQPLWWNGIHHVNYELWDAVIIEVLKGDTFDQSFHLSLREFVRALYNHSKRFGGGYELLREILQNSPQKRKLIFDQLLNETIRNNQENKKMWDMLFESSTEEEKKRYFLTIAENIEAVQYFHDDFGDLTVLFDKKVIFEEIYPLLPDDHAIYNICNNYILLYKSCKKLQIDDEEINNSLRKSFEELISHCYINFPPRMTMTNKLVVYTMEILQIEIEDSTINKALEDNHSRMIKTREEIAKKFNQEYELKNWIF